MKRTLIVITNLLIMGFILFFILRYAETRAEESDRSAIEAFEKMTVTTSQIISNYLEDEQHLCDIWSNYVNSSAEAGAIPTDSRVTTSPKKPVSCFR